MKLIELLIKINNENSFKIIVQSLDAHSKANLTSYPK